MSSVTWNTDGTISVDPPKRPRKLTGTRFASVLGLNRWNTPFQTWCEITGAYRLPFEDTVYTLAGKAIEPKQIQYIRDSYGMDIVDPTMEYGPDYFSKTYGNFFTDKVFGGMWDAIEKEDGGVASVFEFKTTKRSEDWADDVPEYYALQAALYAWLLGCDQVWMVVSFLAEDDYADPSSYECSPSNTSVIGFKLSERYPSFERDYIRPALSWWERHVATGDSPAYDEKADAEYLAALRNETLNPQSDIEAMLAELRQVRAKLDDCKPLEKRESVLKQQLKAYMMENVGDAETATLSGSGVECKLARSVSAKPDEARMKADGVWETYLVQSESFRFTVKFD